MTKLDLSLVDESWHHKVEKSLEEGDSGGIFISMSNKHWLHFVFFNIAPLKEAEIYEEMLLCAYTGCSSNWSAFSLNVIKMMFNIADKERLLQAGDPTPDDGPFTVYRGVAGNGSAKRKRGISWTANFDQAVWFAERFAMLIEKPMVYETIVNREHILAYVNDRNEQEFLCLIPDDLELKKVWP